MKLKLSAARMQKQGSVSGPDTNLLLTRDEG